MNIYTAHTLDHAPTRLIPEGFSWRGLLLGPLWLFATGAWIPGAFVLLATVLAASLLPQPFAAPVGFGLALLTGLLGQDMRRWSLGRRGYRLAEVLAARDEDAALARLLHAHPELMQTIPR